MTTVTLVVMLVFGLTGGVADGVVFGLVGGLAGGLINEVRFFRGPTGREPERLHLRLRRRGSTERSPRTYFKKATSQFASGFAFMLVFGLAIGLVVVGLTGGLADGLVFVVGGELGVGLVFGLVGGLANLAVSVLGDNQDPRNAISPWQLLATDRTVTQVRTVVVVVTFGLAFGLMFVGIDGWDVAGWLVAGLTYGLLVGLIGGLARLVVSAWGGWLLFARLWLPLAGRLPWRPKRFLEDAHHRGVLRQAGAVYQFRHAQLRDHLARHYGKPEP
jgi:hypothetical protein